MKPRREPIIWFIFFAGAALGVYWFGWQWEPSAASQSRFMQYLVEASPAISAALALPALFLLLRFLLNGPLHARPAPSRSRHIIAAILVSLAGISTWEASQMYLQGDSLTFPVFAGALLGSFLFWLFWLLTKSWLDNGHSPNSP